MSAYKLHLGDCLESLRKMPDCSVDSVVCDPPYGLSDHKPADVAACLQAWLAGEPYMARKKGFMGKTWDSWVPGPEVWRECLRVLKPGGHLLAFAGTRTMDLMSMAVRLAGFELRDSIGYAHDGGGAPLMAWTFGSGFPKSTDVSKQIDKRAGVEREVVGVKSSNRPSVIGKAPGGSMGGGSYTERLETAPATEAARQWQGWGSALKPAWEPIIIARKPLIGTIAENVLAHGTGALNIDACRVHSNDSQGYAYSVQRMAPGADQNRTGKTHQEGVAFEGHTKDGRWPANLLHDGSDEVVGLFPANAGASAPVRGTEASKASVGNVTGERERVPGALHGDTGSAARFFQQVKHDAEDAATAQRLFYCAKASKRDREEGLDASSVEYSLSEDAPEWVRSEVEKLLNQSN